MIRFAQLCFCGFESENNSVKTARNQVKVAILASDNLVSDIYLPEPNASGVKAADPSQPPETKWFLRLANPRRRFALPYRTGLPRRYRHG